MKTSRLNTIRLSGLAIVLTTATSCFAVPNIFLYAGGGTSIRDGQTTVAFPNLTNYGTIPHTGSTSVQHSFVIKNLGDANLILAGTPVVISGAGASHFEITTDPTTPITPNDFTILRITYDPTSAGVHKATVNILSNDPDSPSFNFALQGIADDSASVQGADLHLMSPDILKAKIRVKKGQTLYKFSGTISIGNSGQLPSIGKETTLVAYATQDNFLDSDDSVCLKPVIIKKPILNGTGITQKFKFTLPKLPNQDIVFQVLAPGGTGETDFADNIIYN